MTSQETYYAQHDEPIKSRLLALRGIVDTQGKIPQPGDRRAGKD